MPFNDEADVSPSSADYLESPHEAKRKALKAKLEKQGKKDEANKPGADLKSLQLALLKSQVNDKDQKQLKDQQAQKDAAPVKGGTKTREQEIKSQTMKADAKPDVTQMTKQAQAQQKADEQLKKDEVQGEDA